MKKLRQILRYVDSCDGDMEKGSLRCDANVSIRPKGSDTFGTRCEIKNLNSIRYIVQAVDYEIQRQIEILGSGEEISQDTLLFDVALGKTKVMRNKVQEYKSGKIRLYGFFVGEVMKLTKGKASLEVVNSILSENLSNEFIAFFPFIVIYFKNHLR